MHLKAEAWRERTTGLSRLVYPPVHPDSVMPIVSTDSPGMGSERLTPDVDVPTRAPPSLSQPIDRSPDTLLPPRGLTPIFTLALSRVDGPRDCRNPFESLLSRVHLGRFLCDRAEIARGGRERVGEEGVRGSGRVRGRGGRGRGRRDGSEKWVSGFERGGGGRLR